MLRALDTTITVVCRKMQKETQDKIDRIRKPPKTAAEKELLRSLYRKLLMIDSELFWDLHYTDSYLTASYYGYEWNDSWD